MTHSANRNNNEDVVAWFSGSSVMGTEEDAEDVTGWWLVADLAHLTGSLYKGKLHLLRSLHSGE